MNKDNGIPMFMYDKISDSLMISRKKESDVMAGSIRLLNIILDITTDNKVANIEIIDVSDYLNSLGVNSNILSRLKNAEFSLKSIRNGYLISIMLMIGKEKIYVPYNIHLPSRRQVVVSS